MEIQETVTMNSGYLRVSADQNRNTNGYPGLSAEDGEQSYTIPTQRLAPTQNVSEVRCRTCFWAGIPLTLSRFEGSLIETKEPEYADDQTSRSKLSQDWHLHHIAGEPVVILFESAPGVLGPELEEN